MLRVQRLVGARITSGLLFASGAAAVAAAFNTPVAGIMFAIEELASAYEQKLAVQVMGTVVIAGLTAKGISGDYVYSALWACRCRSVRWCWRHRSRVSSAACRTGSAPPSLQPCWPATSLGWYARR